VAAFPSERIGVLVIRAWVEGDPGGVRMRITCTSDISTREEDATSAASIDEACAIVRRWLEAFAARDGVVTGP
jgi:hypothetical protein